MSSSPLILDSLVVVTAGGSQDRSLVAYHRDTGDFVWGGGTARAGYSSPSLARLAGREQILIFNIKSLSGHDPLDGQVLWEHPWPSNSAVVAQPLPLSGDRLFASSGYGTGCKLYHVGPDTLLWETPRLKAKFTNVVHRDGFIYGLDDGVLVCLDVADGQRRWKKGRYGHGQLMLVDDLLLIQAEDGYVALVRAQPERFEEVARYPALAGKTWNNPTLAAPYLLVRNDEEAACYQLTLSAPMALVGPARAEGAGRGR